MLLLRLVGSLYYYINDARSHKHEIKERSFATPGLPDIGGRGGQTMWQWLRKSRPPLIIIITTSKHQVIPIDYAIIAVLVMLLGLAGRRKSL